MDNSLFQVIAGIGVGTSAIGFGVFASKLLASHYKEIFEETKKNINKSLDSVKEIKKEVYEVKSMAADMAIKMSQSQTAFHAEIVRQASEMSKSVSNIRDEFHEHALKSSEFRHTTNNELTKWIGVTRQLNDNIKAVSHKVENIAGGKILIKKD